MSTSIADLIVNVSTNIASLETGMSRAAETVNRAAGNMSASITSLQNKISGVGDAFKTLASLSIAGFGVHEFAGFIEGAIGAQASLVDLATKAGTTAEKMSSLIPAAKLSATSLEDVAAASAKFSKHLALAADGTGKEAAALKALGFDARDAARFLADPAQALFEVSKKLNQFVDDGNKTAIVMTLMGKGAQQNLPFFKLLGEQTELLSRVTNEQALAAKGLEDAYHTLELRGDDLKNSIAAGIVPTLTGLVKVFTDATAGPDGLGAAIKRLAEDGSLAIWVQQTAVYISQFIDGLSRGIDGIKTFVAGSHLLFDSATAALETAAIGAVRLAGGDDSALVRRRQDTFNQLAKDLAEFNVRSKALWNKQASDTTVALETELAAMKRQQAAFGTLSKQRLPDDYNKAGGKPSLDAGAIGRSLSTLTDLTAALNAYLKALSDVEKAYSEGIAKVTQQAISNAQADLERSYSQGLIDFAQYYEGRRALQYKAQQESERLLQDEVTRNKALYDQLAQNLEALEKKKAAAASGTAEYSKLTIDEYNAKKALAEQDAKLATSEANLEATRLKGTQVLKDNVAEYEKGNSLLFASVLSTQKLIDAQELANAAYGMTAEQIQLLTAARAQDRLEADIASGLIDAKDIPALQRDIDKRRELAHALGQGDAIKTFVDGWSSAFNSIANKAGEFISNFVKTGKLNFKGLWDDFATWALATFAKIAAQKIIVQIAGSFGLGGLAENAFAGSNSPFEKLLSGGLGSFGQVPGDAFLPGAIAPGTIGGFADSVGLGSLAPLLGSLGPLVPLLGLAIPLLSGLFKNKPSEVQGQFGVSQGTSGFEDNAFTKSKFGNLGFLDQGTAQFSGEAAQVFNKIVAGALDAFATRFSPEQSDAFATVLKNMTFKAFSGTFTTEDFLQQYGGEALQQVIQAAFEVLDPALASVEAGFAGTADQVAAFSNSLLSIYDATKGLPDAVRANIEGALDSTQATADKVLAFATIFVGFGDSIPGVGQKLAQITGSGIPGFIDALGGAAAALAAFNYLSQNFLTSQQRMDEATATLTADFTNLGLAIPDTHQQFLDLLASFDLTTTAGQQLYASVLALAPLFVQVHGTADAAAGSLNGVVSALSAAAQSAQDFFQQNFFSAAEQSASKLAGEYQQITAAQAALNISIPTSVAGFRALIQGIDQTTPAGKALYAALIVLAPAIFDIANASTTAATAISAAATAINNIPYPDTASDAAKFVSKFLGKIQTLAGASTGDFGDKAAIEIPLVKQQIDAIQAAIAAEYARTGGMFDTTIETLQAEGDALSTFNSNLSKQVAQFTIFKAQYGAGIAQQLIDLQTWYDGQAHIFRNNAAALASLKTIFDQKWAAIIAGTSTAVDAVIALLADLIKGIQTTAGAASTGGTVGQNLQIQMALAAAKIAALQASLATAIGGAATQIQTDVSGLQAYNTKLAQYLADFTILSAQYGSDVAGQLVTLEQWLSDQQTALAGNADALAVLQQVFQDRWAAIISGISTGVTGTISELDRLRKSLLEYVNGLRLGNLSVLSPQQKLVEAQTQFQDLLTKAQGGDTTALGDITKTADQYLQLARDAYASSSQYTDIFVQVQNALRALASGSQIISDPGLGTTSPTTPAGATSGPKPPTTVTTTGGAPVASSADVKSTNALLTQLLAELSALSLAERQAIVGSSEEAATQVVTSVDASATKIANAITARRRR